MDRTKPDASLYHRAMKLVFCMTHSHRRVVEKCISGLGIHHSQHRLLMQLARDGNTPSQTELAKNFDVSPASIAVMLKKLAAAGYIEKSGSAEDGRRNQISITPAGREIVSKSCVYFEDIEEKMFEGVPEEDIGAMMRCLSRMRENLTQYEEGLSQPASQTKE